MNSTLLTPEHKQTIIRCAHRFDGYAYAKETKPGARHETLALQEMLDWIKGSGKLFSNPLENFAVNFYLHRSFHHQGYMPDAYQPDWYQMVFFYLHLYRLPTPAKYRHSMAKEWETRKKGTAEAAAAEIRQLLMRR